MIKWPTNVTLATSDWSRALCHLCNMSITAWVVDRPLMAPNCLVASLGTTRSKIQLPTYDSSNLDKVGVKEIGRRSDSLLPGGWTLGTGITSVSLFPQKREDSCSKGCNEYATARVSQICRKVPQKPVMDLIRTWWLMNINTTPKGRRRFVWDCVLEKYTPNSLR